MEAQLYRRLLYFALAASAVACSPSEPIEGELGVSVQRLRAAPADGGTEFAFEFLATDELGNPLPCADATVTVSAEVSFDDPGGPYEALDEASFTTTCLADTPADVALVLDNSGSQESVLTETQQGATTFKDAVLNRDGMVSITRVSTAARVLSDLTEDGDALQDEIDDLFVNRGWTALWDGIRLGNETLGAGTSARQADNFCEGDRGFSIVVFTNGKDNNSAEEELTPPTPDGIDTAYEDLFDLRVDGVTTPIHTIALGNEVDRPTLAALSNATGGKALTLSDTDSLSDAFEIVSSYEPNSMRVCGSTPATGCGHAWMRLTYAYDTDAGTFEDTREFEIDVPCDPTPSTGRSVTILLTLSDPGIPEPLAGTLVTNAASWVSAVPAPKVLVAQDDSHHGEDVGDTDFVLQLLQDGGFDATRLDEPERGFEADDFTGYDVVWFANPGWPMDDFATFQALEAHLGNGGGVVLQGDDMSWSFGRSFDMSAVTHLSHDSNGTKTCGVVTDDNEGESYAVTISSTAHPLTSGIEGSTFTYGNDIDHTSAVGDGEAVLATAGLDGDPDCSLQTPVIVAVDPE